MIDGWLGGGGAEEERVAALALEVKRSVGRNSNMDLLLNNNSPDSGYR